MDDKNKIRQANQINALLNEALDTLKDVSQSIYEAKKEMKNLFDLDELNHVLTEAAFICGEVGQEPGPTGSVQDRAYHLRHKLKDLVVQGAWYAAVKNR
jgi:hypothetical protein